LSRGGFRRIVGNDESSCFEGFTSSHRVVVPTNGTFESHDEGLSLFLGDTFLPNPVEIDLGFTGFADDSGPGCGDRDAAILTEVTVVKEGCEAKDEGVQVEGLEVPVFSLGNTDTVIDRSKGRMVGTEAYTLGQSHLESNARKNEAAGL
jgi:hypothetical protein